MVNRVDIDRLIEIKDEMTQLVQEARAICKDEISYSNWDAYVFRQLDESIENANPYNQSLSSIIEHLEESNNVDEETEELINWTVTKTYDEAGEEPNEGHVTDEALEKIEDTLNRGLTDSEFDVFHKKVKEFFGESCLAKNLLDKTKASME